MATWIAHLRVAENFIYLTEGGMDKFIEETSDFMYNRLKEMCIK
jgi:hypothetical protein